AARSTPRAAKARTPRASRGRPRAPCAHRVRSGRRPPPRRPPRPRPRPARKRARRRAARRRRNPRRGTRPPPPAPPAPPRPRPRRTRADGPRRRLRGLVAVERREQREEPSVVPGAEHVAPPQRSVRGLLDDAARARGPQRHGGQRERSFERERALDLFIEA